MTQPLAYLLYAVFAVGAVGLYLAMPRKERPSCWIGCLIGLCSTAGLIVVFVMGELVDVTPSVLFYLFAAGAIMAAGRVIVHPKPLYSALYFSVVILCVAAMLVLQHAEFLAIALVMIYAGAILVTYAFVIMLARQSGTSTADQNAREPMMAILIAFVFAGALTGRIAELPKGVDHQIAQATTATTTEANVESSDDASAEIEQTNTFLIGERMFGNFVVTVQIAGVLLLIAMVGAVAMVRKKVPTEEIGPPPPPPGEIGRSVPPY